MPYNILFNPEEGQIYLIDAISGEIQPAKFRTPDQVAEWFVQMWKDNSMEPVPPDLYDRWYMTAEDAIEHPGVEAHIAPKEGAPEPTTPGPSRELKPMEPRTIKYRDLGGEIFGKEHNEAQILKAKQYIALAFAHIRYPNKMVMTFNDMARELLYKRKVIPDMEEMRRFVDIWIAWQLLRINRDGTFSPTFNTTAVIVPLGFPNSEPPKEIPEAFTNAELEEKIDNLRGLLATFRRTKDKYVEADVEEHNRKFPEDKGSVFVRNLIDKVETERNHYAAKLEGNLYAIRGMLSGGRKDWSAMQQVSNYAIEFFEKILPDMFRATDRYIAGVKARSGFIALKNLSTMFVPEVAPRQETFEVEEGRNEYRPGSGTLF